MDTPLYCPQWAAHIGEAAEALKLRIGNIPDNKDSAYTEARGAKRFCLAETGIAASADETPLFILKERTNGTF